MKNTDVVLVLKKKNETFIMDSFAKVGSYTN